MSDTVTETKTVESYELKKNNFFINSVSTKFVVSSVISILFVFAGSFIDTVLVGAYLGEKGLSAMSIISPVYLIYYTIGAVIGIGGSVLAARSLGKDNINEYRKIFTMATICVGVMAVLMTIIAYVFANPITDALCGSVSGETKKYVKDYLMYYFPGGAFTLVSYIPLYFLKTDGKPKISSALFSASAIINIVFSWLFMSPAFNMGTSGASLATSISMGVVSVLGFIALTRGKTELRFVKNSFSFDLFKKTVIAGIPNGMNNLLESARIIFVNFLLISISSSLLSCYTVVRNVSDILISVVTGIAYAVMPLVGVLYNERDYEGTHTVMKIAMKKGLRVMIPLVVITSLIPDLLFMAFGVSDAAVIKEGRYAIVLSVVGIVASYANTLYIGYLTAIKREGIATVMVILRLFALLVAFAFPLSFLIGSKGVWAAFSLCEIFTFVIYLIIIWLIRKRKPQYDKLLIDNSKKLADDFSFSVKNDVNDIVLATQKISEFLEDIGTDMRRSYKVGMALEEILTFLINHCVDKDKESFTDIRVVRLDEEVMLRFRYVGKIYDPMAYYNSKEGEQDSEELLGLKMVEKSATLIDFKQTLGANNLLIMF